MYTKAKTSNAGFYVFCFTLVVMALGIGGWIANLVKLVSMNLDHITGLLIVRTIGVFLPPLGAIMGYL